MKIRLNQLWKVPVYTIAAGILTFWITVFVISRFGTVVGPDNVISANHTVSTIAQTLLFALTLYLGYRSFRKMSKQEIFLSASIIVAFLLSLQTLQYFQTDLAIANRYGMTLAYLTEWCRPVSRVLNLLTPLVGPWPGAFLICFAPYIFMIFGKKNG